MPIFADPREFDMPPEDRDATEMDTIVFGLEVTGTESTGGDGLTHVYSRDLTWAPQGAQAERFADSPIRPVHDDILLAKLLPGQSIRMEVHAVKGIGADHAKFSPVATASYRLAPDIELSGRGFVGDEARQLVAACPMGVFDIEDVGSSGPRAVVKRPRACTTCRECLRPEGWADRVHLRKVNEHFLFRVESTGALPATTLVDMALRVRHRQTVSLSARSCLCPAAPIRPTWRAGPPSLSLTPSVSASPDPVADSRGQGQASC